jgi:hypothetical protein
MKLKSLLSSSQSPSNGREIMLNQINTILTFKSLTLRFTLIVPFHMYRILPSDILPADFLCAISDLPLHATYHSALFDHPCNILRGVH